MESPTTTMSRSSFFDRYYILLKTHYFLFFSAFGILYPILSITLRSRGLSNTEISYINLIVPFLVFFTNPLIGFIADQSRRYLLTLNFILAIVTILYVIMFFLPSIKTHHIQAKMSYDTNTSSRVLDFCASQEVATQCSSRSECGCRYQASCIKEAISDNFIFTMSSSDTRQTLNKVAIDMSEPSVCGIEYRVPVEKYLQNFSLAVDGRSSLPSCEITCSVAHFCHGIRHPAQTRYILLYSLFFILATNLLSNTITIGASIGFATLSRPDLFGQQRVWGTIGFGISAFLASRLYTYFNTDMVYVIMFSIATILCIIVTSFIRIGPTKPKQSTTSDDEIIHEREIDDISVDKIGKETTKKKEISQFKGAALIPLLKKIDVIVFLSLTFIWGMSYGGLDPYLYLYIDEMAPCQSHGIVGLMSLIAASSEVVALFTAGRMLKLLGTDASSIIILLAFAVRFAGYYLIRRPYFLLFMETMHYFNFGIFYVLIAQKADSIAPPGLSGTLQGVVYGVSFGLGRGVGLIAASFIYTRLPSRFLFLIFALFNAAAAILYALYFLLTNKKSKKTGRSNNNINIPKIVIEPETMINEEPLLISSLTDRNHEQ